MTAEEIAECDVWFEKYDTEPKDGKLSQEEFMIAMKNIPFWTVEEGGQKPSDDSLKKLFYKFDVDKSNFIEREEFYACFAAIKNAKAHPIGQKAAMANSLMQLANDKIPGVQTVRKIAQTIGENMPYSKGSTTTTPGEGTGLLDPTKTKLEPSEGDAEVEKPEVEPLVDHAINMVICLVISMFTCLGVFVVFPLVMFWIGVSTGESCDQPLATWVLGMAIMDTLSFGFLCQTFYSIFVVVKTHLKHEGAQGTDMQTQLESTVAANAASSSLMGCLQCFGFIWLILGIVWFDSAGGLFGNPNKSNCHTLAPTLWDICYYYFYVLFVMVLIGPAMCVLLCIYQAILGGDPFSAVALNTHS
jgi:hypothetical protein